MHTDRHHGPKDALGRLFHMGLPELVFRGKQETFKIVDRILPRIERRAHRENNSLARFLDAADKYFFEGAFEDQVSNTLSDAHADECQLLLAAADRVFHGKFDLLGFRDLDFGKPIDWQLDPVSGKRAPLVHWSRIDPLDVETVGDSKVTWELNRHQWLVRLAQGWRLTRYERYAEAAVQHMQDWIRANPPGVGINWSSSLEVALRLIAWCWTLVLIRDANALTPEIFTVFEEAMHAHAMHVERYLSVYFSPNTHLTGEALGLVYAGTLLGGSQRAERWRSTGARILCSEITRQVRADGVYFEQSTCYQRYTVDIYLHFLLLAHRGGLDVAPEVRQTVQSMVNVLVALRQPDGSMPGIGDEDGGMLLPLGVRGPHDFRSTFSTAAVVFRDPVYAWSARSIAPETVWLLGTDAAAIFGRLEQSPPSTDRCQLFPDGGFAIMRSGWDDKAHALIFDAGPLGCHFSSGHGHADLLSIQVSVFGERYLVDAGTCCYTANREARDYFRGTAAHSTVMVDGKAQAEPAGPFAWRDRCGARLNRWLSNDSFSYADAEHNAYHALPNPVTHRRRVAFIDSRYWVIIDDLDGTHIHRADVRFQFDSIPVRMEDRAWVRASRDGRAGLLIRAFGSASLQTNVREGQRDPLEGWVSPDYGCMAPAPAVIYSAATYLPLRVLTLLWPSEDIEKSPAVDVLYDVHRRPFGITLRDRAETVMFTDDEPVIHHSRP